MKKVVERERNKRYYRVLHLPIWIWVFWILPGNLTFDLYTHGPDRRHWIWLAIVAAICATIGLMGKLPGVEPRPYITHWGMKQPNVIYRVVCYTAAWIDLIAPWTLNLLGLILAVATGKWLLKDLYFYLYYPIALGVVLATLFNFMPRTRDTTAQEGAERAWFYVAIWTVVPSQLAAWATWRMGSRIALPPTELAWLRLGSFVLVAGLFLALGMNGKLGRTGRYYADQTREA